MSDVCWCRNEWWVPGKIVEAREQLQWVWKVLNLSIAFLVCKAAVLTGRGTLGHFCIPHGWGADLSQAPCSRDVLLLDIALDNYLRVLLERQDKGSLGGDDLCELVALSLRNAIIAIDSEDLRQVRHCLSRFLFTPVHWLKYAAFI